MTPADSHSLLSDEDPPMPWSYRYSTPEEYLAVKQEPEWDEGGESEAASWATLYADHHVKEEIVFGPEQFQPQDIAMSMQNMLIKTEEDPGSLNLEDEIRIEYEDTPTLSGDQTDQTLEQLPHSYVRLEQTALGEQNTSSSSLTDKSFQCHICHRQFAGQGYLTNHIKSHKDHSCHICLRKFSLARFLAIHMKKHEPKPYSCNLCNKNFTKSSKLVAHMIDHKVTKPYQCNICQGHFKDKKSLSNHKYTHHADSETKQHSCKICLRRFVHKGGLIAHNTYHHSNDKLNDNSIDNLPQEPSNVENNTSIRNNNEQNIKKLGLRLHWNGTLNHTVPKPYSCNICQGQFKSQQSLARHKYEVHSNHTETKPHSCKICDRLFVHRKSLLTHMRRRHPKANEQLGRTTPSSKLIERMLDHTVSKLYSCNICHSKFRVKQSLATHKYLCHWDDKETKPHSCKLCERRFVYRKTLLTHMQMRHPKENEQLANTQNHLIEKSHCCTICQKQFVYRKSLLTHMRRRHPKAYEQLPNTQSDGNEKPLCCDVCQKRFLCKNTLITHMQLRHSKAKEELASSAPPSKLTEHMLDHTVRKPYCCNICQGQFKSRKSMHNHKYKCHWDDTETKPYSCKICERRFVYRKTLVTHMQMRHPKENEQLAKTQSHRNEKPICCDICQKQFLYKRTLITHIRLRHPQAKEELASSTPPPELTERPLDQTVPRRYCCDICQGQYKNKRSLTTHKYTRHPEHIKKKPHSCKICQRRFLYRKTLLTHMQMQHPKAKAELASSAPPSKLTEHMLNHTVPKPYCCNICQGQFKNKKSLHNHKYKRHWDDTETKPYSCKICERRFVYESGLIAHKMYCQNNDKLNENSINKLTQQPSSFTSNNMKQKSSFGDVTNMKTVKEQISHTDNLHLHGKDKIETGHTKENPLCCSICQKRFVYRMSLVTHMRRRHHKSKESAKQLARDQDLTEEEFHEKANESNSQEIIPSSNPTNDEQDQTKEKLHCCTICQQRFVYQKSLVSHMRKHPGGKPDAQLTQSSSLDEQRHRQAKKKLASSSPSSKPIERKLDRTVPRPYRCNICQGQYKTKQNLACHKYKSHWDHTETKPHPCKFCQRRFVHSKSLLSHIQMLHPKESKQLAITQNNKIETPHCCTMCQIRFVHRKSLRTHMRTRHHNHSHPKADENLANTQSQENEKPHSCNVCQKRFQYEKSLLTHLRISHPKPIQKHTRVTPSSKLIERVRNHAVPKPYCCHICQGRFKNLGSLYSHNYKHHSDHTSAEAKPHPCKVCQRRFLYRKTLVTHMRRWHQKEYAQLAYTQSHGSEKPYCCDNCQKRFVYKMSLMSHMRRHHQKSNESGKQLARDQDLTEEKIHEKTNESNNQEIIPSSNSTNDEQDQTKEKPHCCSICQQRFAYQKSLVSHMRKHPGSKPDAQLTQSSGLDGQKDCQKGSVYRKTLRTHKRIRDQKTEEELATSTPSSKLNESELGRTVSKPYSCNICQSKFKVKQSLASHKYLCHWDDTETKPHSCKICERRFVYKKTVLRHMRLLHPETKEEIASSTPASKVSEPMLDHTVPKPYSCDICGTKFRVKQSLATHKYRSHWYDIGTKPHSCKICHRQFVNRKNVVRHMRMRHLKTKEELASSKPASKRTECTVPGPFSCDICQGKFKNQHSLSSHKYKMHSDHTETKPHSCKICERRFVYRKTLLTHLRIRHPKAKGLLENVKNKTENQQCCTVCQKRFVTRNTLLTHVQMQHPEANELLFSLQSQSKEKRHCCTICQRRFIYKNTLLTHMRKRHPKANEQLANTQSNGLEKRHCCDICQRRFVYKKSLISHMRKHLGNKSDTQIIHMRLRRQKANEPKQQFTHNQDLSEEKPHCCKFCQKRFVYRKTLITHMRKHLSSKNGTDSTEPSLAMEQQDLINEKAHCCKFCQKRFVYRKTMITHMRKHRGRKRGTVITKSSSSATQQSDLGHGKAHSCKFCPRRFVDRKTLITHIQQEHQKENEQPQNQDLEIGKYVNESIKQQITSPSNSTKPVQNQVKEKPHCCGICQKRFVYRKTLITHMRKHLSSKNGTDSTEPSSLAMEQQDLINEKAHCCKFCQKRFVYRKTMITHMRKHRGRKRGTVITKPSSSATQQQDLGHGKAHSCKFCQRRFVDRKTLITHLQQEHQNENEQPQSQDLAIGKVVNESNKQQIASPSNSTKPVQDQVKEKPHCCSICQKRFVYERALLTHMKQHTDNEQNNTLIPPTSISVNTEFSSNDQHTQQKLYTCDICEKQFAHKENLDNHLRLHSAVKPYWCNVCNKRFTKLNALNVHTQIHTTGNSFDESTHSHTVEKAFSCNLCREQFEDLDVLIDHARQYHLNEKSFRCKLKNVTN